jgi:hypothetical protein
MIPISSSGPASSGCASPTATPSRRRRCSWRSTCCTTTGDLTGRPLRDPRARLEDVVAGSELVFAVRRLASDGLEAWKQVVDRGYEGGAETRRTTEQAGGIAKWMALVTA